MTEVIGTALREGLAAADHNIQVTAACFAPLTGKAMRVTV